MATLKALVITGSLLGTLAIYQFPIAHADVDYCKGIACTEQTDTCCDESVDFIHNRTPREQPQRLDKRELLH